MNMTTFAPQPNEFISCARREFAYLTTDYGFTETANDVRRYYNPVSVRYGNSTTLVSVQGLGFGFATSVELGVMPQLPGEFDTTFPLWPLAEARQPKLYQEFNETRGQLAQLAVLARLLRRSADDILCGDFTMTSDIIQTVDERMVEQRQLESEREIEHHIRQASEAFWQKDYCKVIELLEPFENHLSQTTAKHLDYARRQL